MSDKPERILVPRDFDPREHLPAKFWRYADSIRYLIGQVAVGEARARKRTSEDKVWVAVRREDAWPLFGSMATWNALRTSLLGSGLLETDNHYSRGVYAKGYRIGPAIQDVRLTTTDTSSEAIVSRIREDREAVLLSRESWLPVHHHLESRAKLISIDEQQAERFAANSATLRKFDIIRSAGSWQTVCGYGRVHTVFTSLQSETRSLLSCDNMAMAEVDVAACQPLAVGFLAATLSLGLWPLRAVQALGRKSETFSGNYINHKPTISQRACIPLRVLNLHLLHDEISNNKSVPGDIREYLECCQEARYYEAMADAWGLPCSNRCERNATKGLCFKHVLFGRLPNLGLSVVDEAEEERRVKWAGFSERWPNVAKAIEAIKDGSYKRLARITQIIESSLMIGQVAEGFRASEPDMPLVTVHDSLIVPVSAVTRAKAAIETAFASIGLRPTAKVK